MIGGTDIVIVEDYKIGNTRIKIADDYCSQKMLKKYCIALQCPHRDIS